MNIITSDSFIGALPDHPWAEFFLILGFKDGAISSIPHKFFRNWLDQEPENGVFHIGQCSGFGVGSIAKYDGNAQKLVVGKYVAGGLRVKFLLNGQHEMRTISTTLFSIYGMGLKNPEMPQYADTVIRNDVWIGDEALFLGGSSIENGCVIGARTVVPPSFQTESYGIYAGSPAKLIRFRFSERVREELVKLAWWDMPLAWVKEHNAAFLVDLTADEGLALETLSILQSSKELACR